MCKRFPLQYKEFMALTSLEKLNIRSKRQRSYGVQFDPDSSKLDLTTRIRPFQPSSSILIGVYQRMFIRYQNFHISKPLHLCSGLRTRLMAKTRLEEP